MNLLVKNTNKGEWFFNEARAHRMLLLVKNTNNGGHFFYDADCFNAAR